MSSALVENRYERRRRETADRIVRAAGELFAERGVAATTVTAICEHADVARQTFFNHFATKQDVAEALAQRGHEFFVEAAQKARREGRDTGDRLGRLFADVHAAAAAAGPMHLDLVTEVLRASFDSTDSTRVRSLNDAIAGLLRAGRSQGDVSRRHALDDQVALVLGSLEHLFFEWTHRPDFPFAERAARMARVLADVLAP